MADRARRKCRHCRLPVPGDAANPEFCCGGCEVVFGLLSAPGLQRFYELGGGQPVGSPPRPGRFEWLDEVVAAGRSASDQARIELDVQGLHCVACVWLLEELWSRFPGGHDIRINPSLGRVELAFDPEQLDPSAYLAQVEGFGYRFAPASKPARPSRDLLMRTGICIALALNAMLFALAGYLGMGPADGPAYRLFEALSAGFATLAVLIGGPVFFRGALAGVRHRVLHLDLPISTGIALAWGSSVLAFATGSGDSYFDTVTAFVALMLVGRFLQQRALERNRDYLLANDGAEHLRVRRVRDQRLERVRVTDVLPGDRLWLVPGDLVPVRAVLLHAQAAFSLDWINGESQPRTFRARDEVPAGAFAAGREPVEVEAAATARESGLLERLATPRTAADELRGRGRFWSRLNAIYVAAVLAIATVAGVVWAVIDPGRSVGVVTAVLVVTCPCAFGLAVPLAFDLALARLRRRGIYIRETALLEKARHVRKVIFDKTGTLTWGRLRAIVLRAPTGEAADVLFTMASSSNHPVSDAIARALGEHRFLGRVEIREEPGAGVVGRLDGVEYRLGSTRFVQNGVSSERDRNLCLFTRAGHVEACYQIEEDLRAGVRDEVEALARRGIEVHLMSGDRKSRVDDVADRIGVPRHRASGELSPEDKARMIERIDEADTLMVGDGLNDARAFDAAYCAGTPALDSPVMPSRADFFFRAGSGAVAAVLDTAVLLRRVVWQALGLGVAYNIVALSLTLTAHMTPLLCAIVMPASSLVLLAYTGWRMRPGTPS